MVVYAALGTSRALSVSVTSTVSILTAEAIAGSSDPRAAAAVLAIVVGAILIVAGLARVGFLADFISLPILALVALAGVLVLGVLQGVLVAVAVSLLTFIYQANKPPVEIVEGMPDGMLVVRPAGRLYAANVKSVTARLAAIADAADPLPEVVVLDAVAIPDLEYTAVVALRELGDEARAHGLARWVTGLRPEQLRMLERFGLGPDVRTFATLDDAVAAFEERRLFRPRRA
jgi:sulfate permease, SulP family